MVGPVEKNKGDSFDLGVLYHIDDKDIHSSMKLLDIVKERRLVFFGGPAPFSKLDTEQATAYARLCAKMMEKVDMVYGIYCQDAFVCKEFEKQIDTKVGNNALVILADGDAFFARSNGLDEDFTFQGLSIRSHRWSAVVKNGKIEYFVSDPYQVVDETHPDKILKYLDSIK
jgi:peroxiredoxin